jgi:hypothetical protein
MPPSVDRRPDDVVEQVGGEQGHHIRDVVGVADAAVRDLVDGCADGARSDGVHPDPVRRELLRECRHEHLYAALGRRVVHMPDRN